MFEFDVTVSVFAFALGVCVCVYRLSSFNFFYQMCKFVFDACLMSVCTDRVFVFVLMYEFLSIIS